MTSRVLPRYQISEAVRHWLREDNPNFDIAAVALSFDKKEGVITISNQCILAGSPFVEEIFTQLQCSVDWKVEEGSKISSVPCIVATIRGPLNQIFQGENLALGILSRASGIASCARKLTDIGVSRKWKGSFAGSRKTTPGFSLVEKYAMIIGGACPHGTDMASLVLIKDNHIDSTNVTDKEKAISQAVCQTRKVAGHHMKIEVESKNEKEAISCALAGADIVLLHQFAAKAACSVAQRLKSRFPRIIVEASGTINENNIAEYMGTGIDIISTNKMTSGYAVIDVSMKFQDYTEECISDAPVKPGMKRPVPQASGGKTVDSANVNKNGDSSAPVDVDADIPDKRRKIGDEKTVDDSRKNSTSTPANKSATSMAPPETTTVKSSSNAVKSSPNVSPQQSSSVNKPSTTSVNKISPATSSKAPQQTSGTTSGKQDSRSPAQSNKPDARGSVEKSDTRGSHGSNRPGNQSSAGRGQSSMAASKRDPQRSFGGGGNQNSRGNNYNQSGQNRGDQRFNHFNRNRGQDDRNNQNERVFHNSSAIQRPQPPQPTGRGIVGSFAGNSGAYQQQMVLQAAVNRATGVSLRPGANTMGNRHDMNNRGMNMGRSLSGYNSMSNDGNRGYNSNRPMGNVDWQYGY